MKQDQILDKAQRIPLSNRCRHGEERQKGGKGACATRLSQFCGTKILKHHKGHHPVSLNQGKFPTPYGKQAQGSIASWTLKPPAGLLGPSRSTLELRRLARRGHPETVHIPFHRGNDTSRLSWRETPALSLTVLSLIPSKPQSRHDFPSLTDEKIGLREDVSAPSFKKNAWREIFIATP